MSVWASTVQAPVIPAVADRVRFAHDALTAHADATGILPVELDAETAVTALLSDLMHLSMALPVDFATLCGRAQRQFLREHLRS